MEFKKYEENTEVQCKHCGDKYPLVWKLKILRPKLVFGGEST